MKTWIIALAVVAVLSMSNFVQAKGHKHSKGIHGKITSVGANTMTLTTGGKKNPRTITVKFDGTTAITVDGAAGAKIDASYVGKRATIIGGTTAAGAAAAPADTITASSIAISTVKHSKKAKA